MPRQPYSGPYRKLVIAFDVGTTFSGISYCLLDPGFAPEIRGVNRFPAQEHVGGDSKIPSILWYDQQGKVRAVGAEARDQNIIDLAEAEAKWFKMHLRPKTLSAAHIRESDIPPLPPNKTAIEVLADFLKYLHSCALSYIKETHLNGAELISALQSQSRIEYVLTHPNGWEGAQQTQIRQAVFLAGLVPDSPDGQARIRLVTEGEASLHYCVTSGSSSDMKLEVGQGIIVIDAGGGTVDLSAYRLRALPNEFEEIAPPQCRLQGSIFVSQRATRHLENLLRNTSYGIPAQVKNMADSFDSTTKLRFRSATEHSYVKFGTVSDMNSSLGIRSGQLKLPGQVVADMFEPSIAAIVDSVNEQKREAESPIKYIFLVGGFAASNWLFSKVQKELAPHKLTFCRPDSHLNKAVADGAVAFYLDHNVTVRVARWTYGIEMLTVYSKKQPELRARKDKFVRWPSGKLFIPHFFSVILSKGTQVAEETEFRKAYSFERENLSDLYSISVKLLCYRGRTTPVPSWIDEEPGMFPVCCTISADTTRMATFLKKKITVKAKRQYYAQKFDVIMSFGLTELKAQVAWSENGVELRYVPECYAILPPQYIKRFQGVQQVYYSTEGAKFDVAETKPIFSRDRSTEIFFHLYQPWSVLKRTNLVRYRRRML